MIEAAQLNGWLVAHFRPARTSSGWRTPVQADGKGFPDLVLVHAKRRQVIFAELKGADGKLTEDQRKWLDALRDACEVAVVWRPSDWPEIVRALRGEAD